MIQKRHKVLALSAGAVALIGASAAGASFVIPGVVLEARGGAPMATTTIALPKVEHQPLPSAVKGIYMSQCAASSASFTDDLIDLVASTELNTIVVDLKDYSGAVAFESETALPGGAGCRVADFRALVKRMHEHGIYVIGRMTTFQDPLYAKTHPELAVHQKVATGTPWKDHKGLSFVDVGAEPFWQYIITLSKEAVALGVDEINYDYIRYPSDGDMKNVYYTHTRGTHAEQLERFFQTLTREMRKPTGGYVPKLSVDLFGMTATNEDDLNIGQQLERAMPYFDYISPMVYPSHYPSGFHGYTKVNEHAYDIVKFSMGTAVARTLATTTPIGSFAFTAIASTTPQLYEKPSYSAQQQRPWLQSFDYPVTYTPAMVAEQIRATYDVGLTSWLFWDAANKYRSLRQVLEASEQ